jgi:hypothetical protein
MNALPAKAAGVGRLTMVTPTPGGETNPLVLAAAEIAGVDDVFRIGGAQAIAALAYGTDRIAATDVVVGPGNAWVARPSASSTAWSASTWWRGRPRSGGGRRRQRPALDCGRPAQPGRA